MNINLFVTILAACAVMLAVAMVIAVATSNLYWMTHDLARLQYELKHRKSPLARVHGGVLVVGFVGFVWLIVRVVS